MLFSIIFAYLGYTYDHVTGAIIGAIIGFTIDASIKAQRQKRRYRREVKKAMQRDANYSFLECFFALLAKLCKADGAISVEEIVVVKRIIKDTLKIVKKRKVKEAIGFFELGKSSNTSFHLYALHLHDMYADNTSFLRSAIHLFFQVSIADAPLNANEERLIRNCAEIFGIHEVEYREILSQYYAGPKTKAQAGASQQRNGSSKQNSFQEEDSLISASTDCFKVLGCEKTDPIDKIKQAYRKLANEYHPDKIIGKDLPSEFEKFANSKFQEIHSAYEEAKKIKGVA